MSKILLLQNKENVITLAIIGALVTVLIANIAVIVPAFSSVFFQRIERIRRDPIDIQSVNQAVELLSPAVAE